MRVWIDRDLCTGDGLCTDHSPSVFVLLEDGISYVRDDSGTPARGRVRLPRRVHLRRARGDGETAVVGA